jgi:hypothetical protein
MLRIVTAVLLLMALSAVTAEFVAHEHHEGMLWMDVWRDNRTHRTGGTHTIR